MPRTAEEIGTDYHRFAGKCREMAEAEVARDPTLRLVRGHYYEPLWSQDRGHWWCEKPDGTIVDPTRLQFPSGGIAEFYTEYKGIITCEQCGKEVPEAEACIDGHHAFCSSACYGRCVGVY